ncbi:MAG: polymer-forming cytoskeletal protein [Rhodospirillaceae bacterium]
MSNRSSAVPGSGSPSSTRLPSSDKASGQLTTSAAEDEVAKPSFFAKELTVRGRVVSRGALYVAGQMEGEVTCKTLFVTPSGLVDGVADCEEGTVENGGRFNGVLQAKRLGIKARAVLNARIQAGEQAVRKVLAVPTDKKSVDPVAPTTSERSAPTTAIRISETVAAE